MLPQYTRYTIGNDSMTADAVCKDGAIRPIRTERYADGFHAFVRKEDGFWYTNHKGYKTVAKARNAAAKW